MESVFIVDIKSVLSWLHAVDEVPAPLNVALLAEEPLDSTSAPERTHMETAAMGDSAQIHLPCL